jgi:hypothetical protein
VGSVVKDAMHDVGDMVRGAMNDVSEVVQDVMHDLSRGIEKIAEVVTRAPVMQTINRYEASHPPPSVSNHSLEDRNGRRQTASSESQMNSTNDNIRQRSSAAAPDLFSSSEDELEEGSQASVSTRSRQHDHIHGPKLPPFTGKEPWDIWFNRFSDVAARHRWSTHHKVDELLPRLQGVAGEFVFGQLTHEARNDFVVLVTELKNRFRRVETSKAYGIQFSRRDQKPGESVELFAAELKRLYDKAHANRDSAIRCEDILRRFLDGLYDWEASFQVEYVKEPSTVDQAVVEVVNYQEAKRFSRHDVGDSKYLKRSTRRIGADDSEECLDELHCNEDTLDQAESRIARAYNGQQSGRTSKFSSNSKDHKEKKLNSEVAAYSDPGYNELKELISMVCQASKSMEDRMQRLERGQTYKKPQGQGYADQQGSGKPAVPYQQSGRQRNGNWQQAKQNRACFRCGEVGHFLYECKNPSLAEKVTQQIADLGKSAEKTEDTKSGVIGSGTSDDEILLSQKVSKGSGTSN